MKDDGGTGAAFPTAYWATPESDQPSFRPGMSLRDWFAGMALAGLGPSGMNSKARAYWAYEYADAMLAQRIKKEGDD